MAETIRVQMMGSFAVYVDELRMDTQLGRSRKSVSLMELLVLEQGAPVSNARVYSTLWADESAGNPEAALKTLVSRMRQAMNGVAPGFVACIVSDRGAYHWECPANVSVDALEIMELLDALEGNLPEAERRRDMNWLLSLYTGDLLQFSESEDWLMARKTALHNRYMAAVYAWLDELERQGADEEVCAVCRTALEIDRFDDRLHMALIDALVRLNRAGDAMTQYNHAIRLNTRYLGVQPSEALREYYGRITRMSLRLEDDMERIRGELEETEAGEGATVCEYGAFKEICSMLMRNLERLHVSTFLGVVTLLNVGEEPMDSIRQDDRMNALLEILRCSLRRSDTVTRYSPNVAAFLLPTANYETGKQVMERIRGRFYRKCPSSDVRFDYRLTPLGGGSMLKDKM